MKERLSPLNKSELDWFARKGFEGGPGIPQSGLANGVEVRRIMQITRDFARQTNGRLRALDLGCGDGAYAIEAALRGKLAFSNSASCLALQSTSRLGTLSLLLSQTNTEPCYCTQLRLKFLNILVALASLNEKNIMFKKLCVNVSSLLTPILSR